MILYEIITGEVIVDSVDQSEGYKIVKSFLKNKTHYVEKLVNSLDEHQTTADKSEFNIIKKNLLYIFTRCIRKEPFKRIDINDIIQTFTSLPGKN